jgi:hypothetical protein
MTQQYLLPGADQQLNPVELESFSRYTDIKQSIDRYTKNQLRLAM